MSKFIIESNSAIAVVGQSPAWKTGEDVASFLSLVQGCDVSVSYPEQQSRQIGDKEYAVDHMISAPEVNINFNYYLGPHLNNEILFGMSYDTGYVPAINGFESKNQNIYLVLDRRDAKDGLDGFRQTGTSNFSGYNVLSFGNCYLNKYSVEYSLNSIARSSLGFASSNVRTDVVGSNGLVTIPAINSPVGNASGAGFLNLNNLKTSISGGFIDPDALGRSELNAPAAISNMSSFTLQNLEIGGVPLASSAKPILQTFGLNLDLSRTNLFGLGSNYVFNRKLQYPMNGQVQLTCLVSGLNSGEASDMLVNENSYTFEVAFSDYRNLHTGFYKIEGAKLDNIKYTMQVNDVLTFDATFKFQATNTGGFFMKRAVSTGVFPYVPATWENLNNLWQNININWQNV